MAVVVAGALMIGAAWHSLAADTQKDTQKPAAKVSTQITHSIAGGRDSYADVVSVAAPAVVTIRTEGKARMSPTGFDGQEPDDLFRRFFGEQFGQRGERGQRGMRPQREPRQRALGSGVIVTTDGYVLTNYHVVDGADDIRVELTDDRTISAKVVGSDKASDLALLKVTASDLHPIALGNSDGVKVGDVVLAVGNPLGVGQTVTMGIISAKAGPPPSATAAMRTSCRLTRRSTTATPAARSSTPRASWSVSTRRSCRTRTAISGSASRFR
jgi:S1-C subfamily serine protease